MREPAAVDPNALRRVLEQLDETRKLLTNERKRAGILQAMLERERAARMQDAAKQHEQRPSC